MVQSGFDAKDYISGFKVERAPDSKEKVPEEFLAQILFYQRSKLYLEFVAANPEALLADNNPICGASIQCASVLMNALCFFVRMRISWAAHSETSNCSAVVLFPRLPSNTGQRTGPWPNPHKQSRQKSLKRRRSFFRRPSEIVCKCSVKNLTASWRVFPRRPQTEPGVMLLCLRPLPESIPAIPLHGILTLGWGHLELVHSNK